MPRKGSPYGDPDYLEAVAALRRYPTRCQCGRLATTVDHVPPLALHQHRAGTGCCRYLPACPPCNMGAGAAIAARRRLTRRPTASRQW